MIKKYCAYISYFKEGTKILHREDGPAVEYPNGDKVWYQNDQLHREDGPAVKYSDGSKYWYYEGKRINCNSQEEFEKIIKLKIFW